jgi:lipoyl(octanoyl) transferase
MREAERAAGGAAGERGAVAAAGVEAAAADSGNAVATGGRARPLVVRRLGRVAYEEALALQARLVQERRAGEIEDQLLLLEHPHVITLGSSSRPEHVLFDAAAREARGIALFETGRGGDVTYHGPGQLIGYPILDLKPDRCDLHRYVRDIEEALIRALADFGVAAARKPGLTGAWVGEEKVAAIGVRVSSGWITSHGFALNVTTDLGYFGAIVPCGIFDHGVTSLARLLGAAPAAETVERRVAARFAEVFVRRAVDAGGAERGAPGVREA